MEAWYFAVIAGLMICWAVKIYNTLVSYQSQYKNGFQQISVQLKRRVDLIGNLVEVAKEYMNHESDTLLELTVARETLRQATKTAETNPGNNEVMKNLCTSQVGMENALSGFNVRVEDYPDLKANETMMQLSEELTSTENRVAAARQGYNDLVQKYNEYKMQFPNVIIAKKFGFIVNAGVLVFEESLEELNTAPKVKF